MYPHSRRDFLYLSLATSAGLVSAAEEKHADVHQQLLDLAARQHEQRRARFAAVKTRDDLQKLQTQLRDSFLILLDDLPKADGPPPIKKTGTIDDDDYVIDKLVCESLPGYFVSALLYKPKKSDGPAPGILSPCGHSTVGKAADTYQTLHINLVKRGAYVLTYDPVGQGERSQFWDAENQKSHFNLSCGEHAVLGNPLYLLGTSLARYRIWDGMRGLDLLASLKEVDPKRLGCIGNSGGGTLTAYIAALDPRVQVAIPGCYITTLPRRMGNRIQRDPDADPEQDIFGFVSAGIDHAGLLALRAPRPTLVAAAKLDFFPIEGARESFAEAKHLFEVAGAGERIALTEADQKHGLTQPLRQASYAFFDRWLFGREQLREKEIEVKPRPAKELLVCADGQVNVTFKSKPLLPLAWAEFEKRKKPPRKELKELLRLDPNSADFQLTEVTPVKEGQRLVICLNGNEAPDWREEKEFLKALADAGRSVVVVDPRGVGKLRPDLAVKGHDYADALCGVEENIAYNAFLTGEVLLGKRVADVQKAIAELWKSKPGQVILCGRRDAALVACFTAALEWKVTHVVLEDMPLSFKPLFAAAGQPINAASVVPGLLRDFGDILDVLGEIGEGRFVLLSAPRGDVGAVPRPLRVTEKPFSKNADILLPKKEK
jgi:cephalosporin-C deacetylase-like acetyl esterase